MSLTWSSWWFNSSKGWACLGHGFAYALILHVRTHNMRIFVVTQHLVHCTQVFVRLLSRRKNALRTHSSRLDNLKTTYHSSCQDHFRFFKSSRERLQMPSRERLQIFKSSRERLQVASRTTSDSSLTCVTPLSLNYDKS